MADDQKTQPGFAWWRDWRLGRAMRVLKASEVPEQGRLSFFAPDFALSDPQPWLWGDEIADPVVDSVPAQLPALKHRAEPSSADFAKLHENIMRRIHGGEFEKVVPIVAEDLEFAGPLNFEMFPPAHRAYSEQYSFGFDFAGRGVCGVTPELLFSCKDGELQTMALAGTGAADGPNLLNDPKERHEHNLVIEHIGKELSSWGAPDIGSTQEKHYGKLKHLYTPIKLKLREPVDFMDLVVRLHPTAALGGWPRRPAVEWLASQDFHATRRRFGAPFGYCDGEDMKCVVAIRCIQWWGECALVAAGCGVVEKSQALREWNELALKRSAIYQLLGLQL